MSSIAIRDAREQDLTGVLRVLAESGIDGGHSFTVEEAREHYARIRQWPNFRLLVAVIDSEIVREIDSESAGEIADEIAGTYTLVIMDKLGKRGTPAGVVEDVAVLPSHQGRGIGRAMMEHARAECRRAGCYKLALSSNLSREDAHRFYDSLGFERHGFSFLIDL